MKHIVLIALIIFSPGLVAPLYAFIPHTPVKKHRMGINPFSKYPVYLCSGLNMIDDNGEKWRRLFDFRNSWNFTPYPNFIEIQQGFHPNFQAYMHISVTTFTKNGTPHLLAVPVHIASVAAGIHYSIFSVYEPNSPRFRKTKKILDMYLLSGIGYIYKPEYKGGFVSVDLGGGAFIKLTENIRLFATAQGIIALGKPTRIISNFKNYTLGLAFQLPKKNFRNPVPHRFRMHKPKTLNH